MPPLVVVNQQTTDRDQGQSTDHTESYLHHLLLPETLAQFGLLLAGIVGICVAIKTVKAIQRQALIMIRQTRVLARQAKTSEDALSQAKISSDTLANIERAWVDIRLIQTQGDKVYTVELKNYGRTVAHVTQIVVATTLVPVDESPPISSSSGHRKSKLLMPNEPWSALPLNLDHALGSDKFYQVTQGKMKLNIRGIVHYASIAADCTSECLYYWDAAPNHWCLVPVEAPEYNQHT